MCREAAVFQNALTRIGRRVVFEFEGEPVELKFPPSWPGVPLPAALRLRCVTGAMPLHLELQGAPFIAKLAPMLGKSRLSEIPPDLRDALFEALAEPLFDKLEQWSGWEIKINETELEGNGSYNLEIDKDPAWTAIPIALQENGRLVHGRLGLTPEGCAAWGGLIGKLPAAPTQPWHEIAQVEARFVAGHAVLESAIFRSCRPGDVVVADAWGNGLTKPLRIDVGGGLGYYAIRKGRSYMVESGLQEVSAQNGGNLAQIGTVDDIPIELTFELGSRRLYVRDLGAIGPGYIFEIDAPASETVIVRANGMRIGSGEIVDIGGRPGVRLLSIARSQSAGRKTSA
jgi:type III secretion protein Q